MENFLKILDKIFPVFTAILASYFTYKLNNRTEKKRIVKEKLDSLYLPFYECLKNVYLEIIDENITDLNILNDPIEFFSEGSKEVYLDKKIMEKLKKYYKLKNLLESKLKEEYEEIIKINRKFLNESLADFSGNGELGISNDNYEQAKNINRILLKKEKVNPLQFISGIKFIDLNTDYYPIEIEDIPLIYDEENSYHIERIDRNRVNELNSFLKSNLLWKDLEKALNKHIKVTKSKKKFNELKKSLADIYNYTEEKIRKMVGSD